MSKPRMEKQPGGGALLRPTHKKDSPYVSPASLKMKSICRAKSVAPRMAKTTRLVFDRDNAMKVAADLMALAHDTKGDGEYIITAMNIRGGPGRRQVNVVKRLFKKPHA